MNTQARDQALRAAAMGIPVVAAHYPLPDGGCSCPDGKNCSTPGKHPYGAGWQRAGTTDPDNIIAFFTRRPNSNYAMLSGSASGVVWFDLDRQELMEDPRFDVPTWRQKTGRGTRHIGFRIPEGVTIQNSTCTAGIVGLDTRGEGGCVIGAGSKHSSGNRYEWESGFEPWAVVLADLPDELLLLALKGGSKERKPKAPRSGEGAATYRPGGYYLPDSIPEGERNTTLISLAGGWQKMGLPDATIWDLLNQANGRCVPSPLPEREIEGLYRQAINFDKGIPWEDYRKTLPDHEPLEWHPSKNGKSEPERGVAPAVDPEPLPKPPTRTLPEVLATFQKWMHMPDTGLVEVTLGAVAANHLPGAPCWLMVVGPPSSGKTETLRSIRGLPHVFSAATVTEPALLSGTSKRERGKDASGGLLRQIGAFGILALKDFTSILSMHRDARGQVLAAFREVYDGHWTRHVGADGGRELDRKSVV